MEKDENKKYRRKWDARYCSHIMRETISERNWVIFFGIVIFVGIIFFLSWRSLPESDNEDYQLTAAATKGKNVVMSEEQIYEEVKSIQEKIDTGNWKKYQSQWYGFDIKYPDNFNTPVVKKPSPGLKWEYRFEFRKKEIESENPYIGFDVAIYNINKARELMDSAEFPAIKKEEFVELDKCENIGGHLIETGDYPAEEIYIPPIDNCYDPALFFSFTRGDYRYNIVPVTKEGSDTSSDPRVGITDNFPEFFSIISTAKLIDIVRPKLYFSLSSRSGIAPKPVSFARVGGQLVCAKKNDHPAKSKQDKKRHLDMECCLDPDEYPNPHCHYDQEKYGKYL